MNLFDSNTSKSHFVLRLGRGMAYSLAVIALVSCFAIGIASQALNGTGSIGGVVTDPSGAVVPDAGVAVKNTETNVEIKTKTDVTIQRVPPDKTIKSAIKQDCY
jgi:hypothetical protein